MQRSGGGAVLGVVASTLSFDRKIGRSGAGLVSAS